LSNQYEDSEPFGRMYSIVEDIGDYLPPVSPAKLIILLDQAFGEQGPDALVISRGQYYRAVAEKVSEIQSDYQTEAEEYRSAHIRYLRRRNALTSLHIFLSFLNTAALFVGVFFGLLPLITLYYAHVPLQAVYHIPYTSLYLNLASGRDIFIILGGAIIACALTFSLQRAVSRQATREYIRLEPAARQFYDRLTAGFRAVVISLMRAARELRSDPVLRSDRAPTLVEIGSARVFPSETFDRIVEFLQLHVTSAVGVAGQRGAGKSTLLRWLANTLQPDWITVYLPTPATYDSVDFARMIFRATANAVLTSYQSKTIPISASRFSRFIRPFRARPSQDRIVHLSNDVLNLIGSSRTDQWTIAGGLSAKGASLNRQKQTTITQKELTHPELISAFTQFLESYGRFDGHKILIAIDELDKLASAEEAIGAINSLKDLFHLPNTHFVVSVSEDALIRFVMRGIPFRDVFDSSFDDIVQVEPPSPEDAWKLLSHRTGGFPISVALFCYAWSGGIPRDLIRTARECVNIRRRLDRPVTVGELALPIVRNDVKDALAAALTTTLTEGSTLGVESMLALRRKIEDESISLKNVLQTADLQYDLENNSDEQGRILLLKRLALYIKLGYSIVTYFTNDFDGKLAADYIKVVEIIRKFGRAKLALSTYPSEAEWLLTEVVKVVTTDGQR
jgi:energy-coupling factor transporter ATP-binding protein EcfA2